MSNDRDLPRAAATIGVFDGVHRGHQEVLRRVIAAARAVDGVAVAVTFARHPLATLDPPSCPIPLTTVDERRALLLGQGIDEVVMLDFDAAMARLTAREFIELVLLRRYALRVLVVGADFAMGRNRSGDVSALRTLGKELGFSVEVVEPVHELGGPVSSTRLRRALAAGDVDEVRNLLGRDYTVTGTVVEGHGRGRELGFPTANLAIDEPRMLVGDGVYAAFARVIRDRAWGDASVDGEDWRPAVVNVGLAPTFGEGERRVEVHLLDSHEELNGLQMAVRFVARLRGEIRFPNVTALRAQITADVAMARSILAALPARSPAG